MTPRRFGTDPNSSAPHESTTCLPSNGNDLSAIGCEPDASTTCFASELPLAAIGRREFDPVARQQLAVTLQRGDAGRLEQAGNALGRRLDDAGLALLHRRDVERETGRGNAVRREFRVRAVIQLGRFEQRLRRNAAGVEAGAAKGIGAVVVLPFVDAGNLELVLRRADGTGITGRAGADHDDVVRVRHGNSVAKRG